MPSWEEEDKLLTSLGLSAEDLVCGIDEVGRGCLAGPVVAYAVAFKSRELLFLNYINDSKKLTPVQREHVSPLIKANAYYGKGSASPEEIEDLNIYWASILAMERAYRALATQCSPSCALVDGKAKLNLAIPVKSLVKGDGLSYSIAAASILAKVDRDREICQIDKKLNFRYNFKSNKSYATRTHLKALESFGPSAYHRFNFAPIKHRWSRQTILTNGSAPASED